MSRLFSSILFMGAVALTINLGACSDNNLTPTKAKADGVVEAPKPDPNIARLAEAVEKLSTKVDGIKQPDPAPPVDVDAIAKAVQLKLVPDGDGDGISDAKDECIDKAEDDDDFEDEDGCPEFDNDGDHILDAADKCPDTAGLPDYEGKDPDWNGCPPRKEDLDGDEILNEDDDCPRDKGPASVDADQNGCPTETPPPADPVTTPVETPPPADDCHDKPAKKVIVVKVLTKEEQDAAIAKLQEEMAGQKGQWDAIKALRDKDVEHDREIAGLTAKYGKLADGWTAPAPTPAPSVVSLGEPNVIVKP